MPRRTAFDRVAVDSLIARDDGVLLHRELKDAGVPASTIGARIGPRGSWRTLLPGVVLVWDHEPTWRQRLIAAHKYAGEGSVLTGVAALHNYRVRAAPPTGEVHVLVPHPRQPATRDFVVIERTVRPPEPRVIGGLPFAPPARATMDAMRRVRRLNAVRECMAEVVQTSLCGVADLSRELREGSVRGSALPRIVMTELIDGVRAVSEAKSRSALIRHNVRLPLFNVTLLDAHGRFIAETDGYYPDIGMAVEQDSVIHHLGPAAYRRTQLRHLRMGCHGILVLPCPPAFAEYDPEGFARHVAMALEANADRPAPNVRVVLRDDRAA